MSITPLSYLRIALRSVVQYGVTVAAILFLPGGVGLLALTFPAWLTANHLRPQYSTTEKAALAVAIMPPISILAAAPLLIMNVYTPYLFVAVASLPSLLPSRANPFHLQILKETRFVVGATVLLLILLVYIGYAFPFSPVFNADHWLIIDLARWLAMPSQIPHWSIDEVFPTSTRMLLYPSNILWAVWGSIPHWTWGSIPGTIRALNILCVLFLIAVSLPVSALFGRRAGILAVLIIVNIPHVFPAFLKTTNSDIFQIYYTLFFYYICYRYYIDGNREYIKYIIIFLSVSFLMRYFLFVNCILIVAGMEFAFWLMRISGQAVQPTPLRELKSNIKAIFFSAIIVLAWPLTMLYAYGSVIGPHGGTFAGVAIAMQDGFQYFNDAIVQANFNGEPRAQRLIGDIFAPNIYYRTLPGHQAYDGFAWAGAPLFLILLLAATYISLRPLRTILAEAKPAFLLTATSMAAPLIMWLLIDSKMAGIKYALASIAIVAMSLAYTIHLYLDNASLRRKLVYEIICLLLLFRFFVLSIPPQITRASSAFPTWRQAFHVEYGEKLELFEAMKRLETTPENTLMLIRGERGNLVPVFTAWPTWQWPWYEQLKMAPLHKAQSATDAARWLKEQGFKFVISMPVAELNRFYIVPFTSSPGRYSEALPKALVNGDPHFLPVYTETPAIGLEMTIYRVQ